MQKVKEFVKYLTPGTMVKVVTHMKDCEKAIAWFPSELRKEMEQVILEIRIDPHENGIIDILVIGE